MNPKAVTYTVPICPGELASIASRRNTMGGFITYASEISKPRFAAAFDDSERLQKQVEALQQELSAIRNASFVRHPQAQRIIDALPQEDADAVRFLLDRQEAQAQGWLAELIEIGEVLEDGIPFLLDTRVDAVKKLVEFQRNRLATEKQARIDNLRRE